MIAVPRVGRGGAAAVPGRLPEVLEKKALTSRGPGVRSGTCEPRRPPSWTRQRLRDTRRTGPLWRRGTHPARRGGHALGRRTSIRSRFHQQVAGDEAIAAVHASTPDLILPDVMMPKLDGFAVCRRRRADPSLPFIPIILVTAKADSKDIVTGLEAGGDEYLTKPVDQAARVARVKSMLRIRSLHDTVQTLADERAEWIRTREQRVEEQVERFTGALEDLIQLEEVGRLALKGFSRPIPTFAVLQLR